MTHWMEHGQALIIILSYAGGRFDRFRSNEKKENGEVSTTEEGIADKESDGGVAETAVKQVAEEAM